MKCSQLCLRHLLEALVKNVLCLWFSKYNVLLLIVKSRLFQTGEWKEDEAADLVFSHADRVDAITYIYSDVS